jgi:hypothetical protein
VRQASTEKAINRDREPVGKAFCAAVLNVGISRCSPDEIDLTLHISDWIFPKVDRPHLDLATGIEEPIE